MFVRNYKSNRCTSIGLNFSKTYKYDWFINGKTSISRLLISKNNGYRQLVEQTPIEFRDRNVLTVRMVAEHGGQRNMCYCSLRLQKRHNQISQQQERFIDLYRKE